MIVLRYTSKLIPILNEGHLRLDVWLGGFCLSRGICVAEIPSTEGSHSKSNIMASSKNNFTMRVLLSRSSYGVYGLLLLSASLLFLKWRGAVVLIPDVVLVIYPFLWLMPVFVSGIIDTARFNNDTWSRFTWIVFCVGGALWFGYVFRSIEGFNAIAVSSLMAGLFILFGTSHRWQMVVYWLCFVLGEGLGVFIHAQQLRIEDAVVPITAGIHIIWASLTSDLFRRQIEKNKSLMQRMRQDNILIRREQELVRAQTIEIEEERQKSEELLRNILPERTANELKTHGKAEPKTHGMVTVMFTDFKDFTSVSESISPELLVREINDCFCAFDDIMERHKVEKIKTVGDAYIAVAGLPEPSFTHALDAIKAANDIISFMNQRMIEKERNGEVTFEIRIGIHTGPVVAGIVGRKKFAYDIWGDTVNLAARMEQNSEAGKINISGATYALVKKQINCQHRGKIQAKNKGEMDMYFVDAAVSAKYKSHG